MYDIVIIGAGPSGSTLARMLNKKYNVLLVDKRNLDEENNFKREKCCGGLLAPDAQKVLAHLGLGVPKEVLTGPQMFSVKSIDFNNRIERYYPRDYINVDREKFDRWLVSLIPNKVETAFNCIYQSYKLESSYIEVKLRKKDENFSVKTKILVGADGAISRLRQQTFDEQVTPSKYVAVQEWYKTDENMPYYTSIFDKDTTDFYSWIIQKEDSLLVGSAIPIKSNVNKRFKHLIRTLKKQGLINGEAYKKAGTLIMRTERAYQINGCKGQIALIGEAAGLISPSSAEGISYALRSGAILAKSINKLGTDFEKYYLKKLRGLKVNIFLKNLKVSIMYNKVLRKLIMKSRVLSMDIKE